MGGGGGNRFAAPDAASGGVSIPRCVLVGAGAMLVVYVVSTR